MFLDECKVGNLKDQKRVVAVRGRSGKLQLFDRVFGDLVHAHSGDLRLLQ